MRAEGVESERERESGEDEGCVFSSDLSVLWYS